MTDAAGRVRREAFTLVELLAVLGLVGALAALAFPALKIARAEARASACASNLRQMALAALVYADEHGGVFPWAMRYEGSRVVCWDFETGGGADAAPGPLWSGIPGGMRILQCPAFLGGQANWAGDPWTGYNYNSSYIGKAQGDPGKRQAPARLSQVDDPARTALFGDGQYVGGANKFMRAPVRDKAFDGSGSSTRLAGTQGFRHRGRTNVAFCDGHVESLRRPYKPGEPGETAPSCGFISPDNSLYATRRAGR